MTWLRALLSWILPEVIKNIRASDDSGEAAGVNRIQTPRVKKSEFVNSQS